MLKKILFYKWLHIILHFLYIATAISYQHCNAMTKQQFSDFVIRTVVKLQSHYPPEDKDNNIQTMKNAVDNIPDTYFLEHSKEHIVHRFLQLRLKPENRPDTLTDTIIEQAVLQSAAEF